jgi:hypothetical protein
VVPPPVNVSWLTNCPRKKFPPPEFEYPVGLLNVMPDVTTDNEQWLPVAPRAYIKYGPAGNPEQADRLAIWTPLMGVEVMRPPVGPVILKVAVATGLEALPPPPDIVY